MKEVAQAVKSALILDDCGTTNPLAEKVIGLKGHGFSRAAMRILRDSDLAVEGIQLLKR